MSGGSRSRILVLEGLLELETLDVLLVLNLLLDILISLEEFVVLRLSQLQSLIQVGFQLFLQGIHLILLLLNQLGLSGDDLLGSLLHVLFPLFGLHLNGNLLDLVSFLILLLLREGLLNGLLVQKISTELERNRQLLAENGSVVLDLDGVSILQL